MESLCASSLRSGTPTATAGSKLDAMRAVCNGSLNGHRLLHMHTVPAKSLSSAGKRTLGLNPLKVKAQYESGGVPATGLSGLPKPNFGVTLDPSTFGAQPAQAGSGFPPARTPTKLAAAAMTDATKGESKTAKLFLDMEATKLELMVC